MNLPPKRIFLIVLLSLFITIGYGQTNAIKIRHIANAGLFMTDGDLNIYLDFPYKSGAFGYTKYPEAELDSLKDDALFLFTHRHGDHYYKKALKKKKKQVYGPWKMRKKDESGIEIINDSANQFAVKAYKNKHRFSLKHCSYLITWHGKRIFIAGDAESPQTISTMEDIDWAFVPDWLLYYVNEGNVKIDAENIGIYHLYPNDNVEDDYGFNFVIMRDLEGMIELPY